MSEIERARELIAGEFKKLNDKLAQSKGSSRTEEGVEARFNVSRFNEQLEHLLKAAELVEAFENMELGG